MKITICGSMSSSGKMIKASKALKKVGHEVLLPKHAEQFSDGEKEEESQEESTESKIKEDLIRYHYQLIKDSEAILVVNPAKNGVEDYIGGNAFFRNGLWACFKQKNLCPE